MADFLPPIVAKIVADTRDFTAGMGKAGAEAETLAKRGGGSFGRLASYGKAAFLGLGTVAVGAGLASVKMAGDFQESMTQLVTGAGESEKNIALVRNGILKLSGQVGESASELAQGMYMIESAGFHGAAGLNVLKIAAEGAKVGGADMATVANALTSALNAYRLPASKATSITNQLVATVASGKMHMQDLAGALGTILPSAAALHVPLEQVGAAIATMTAQGTPAADAATYLRFTLASLANPTAKAQKTMKGLGLTSAEVSTTLTHHGLTAALELLTDHIGKKFPAGSAQYTAALANMVGGTRGMQAALELTGSHLKTFKANVDSVSDGARHASGDVTGWAKVQEDFNQKLDRAKASVEAMAIRLGTLLIPWVEKAASAVAKAAAWLDKHRVVAIALAGAIGGVLVVAIAAWVASMAAAAATALGLEASIAPIILIAAAIGAAALLLATHWRQVWDGIKTAVSAAWSFMRPVFHEIGSVWSTVWHGIEKVTRAVWSALRPLFSFIWNVGLFPIRVQVILLEAAFKLAWDGIKIAAKVAWAVLKPVFSAIVKVGITYVKTNIQILRTVWDTVWHGIKATLQAVWSVIKPIFDAIQRAVGDTIGAIDKVLSAASKVGGGLLGDLSHLVPHFAGGVTNFGGGLAVVGEHGPELLALPKGSSVIPNHVAFGGGPSPVYSGGGVATGGDVYNVTIGTAYGADADELAQKVRLALIRLGKRNGNSTLLGLR